MPQQSRSMKYTMKAAELRAIAEDDDCGKTRQAILDVANIYEQLAKSAERLEHSASSSSRVAH
jgi:hypothetical protein